MPVPLVVVELPTSDLEPPHAAAMFEACSAALGKGECIPAGLRDPEASAVAIISFRDAERRSMRVEVGRRRDDRRAWRSRELVFQERDEPSERFRTVGFTIASLVGEIEPRPSDAATRSTEPARRPRRPLAVSLGVATGPGLDAGLNRLGAAGRAAYFPLSLPLFATISIRYAVRAQDNQGVAVSWLTPAAGAGFSISLPLDFALRARLEAVYERVWANAYDAISDRSEQASRWVAGAQAGMDLAWPERGLVGALLVFDLERLTGETAINAFGARVGSAGPTSYDFGVALELRLPP